MCIQWKTYYRGGCDASDHVCFGKNIATCKTATNSEMKCGRQEIIKLFVNRPCPICLLHSLRSSTETTPQQYFTMRPNLGSILLDDERRKIADRTFELKEFKCADAVGLTWSHKVTKGYEKLEDCTTEYCGIPFFPVAEPLNIDNYIRLERVENVLYGRLLEHWGNRSEQQSDSEKTECLCAAQPGHKNMVENFAHEPARVQLYFYVTAMNTLVLAQQQFWKIAYDLDPELYNTAFWLSSLGLEPLNWNSVWKKVLNISKVVDPSELPECQICLESYATTNETPLQLPCRHIYGKECLKGWLETDWSKKGFGYYTVDLGLSDGFGAAAPEETEDAGNIDMLNLEEEEIETLKVCSLCDKDFDVCEPGFEEGYEEFHIYLNDPSVANSFSSSAAIQQATNSNPTPSWMAFFKD